jgi:hypothetical protein
MSIRLIEVIKDMKLQHSKIEAIPSPLEGEGHDCMARIVPNNPFAFPPSLEVSAGGRATQEQLPRMRRLNKTMLYLINPPHPNPLPSMGRGS